jgi:hypothetical protein
MWPGIRPSGRPEGDRHAGHGEQISCPGGDCLTQCQSCKTDDAAATSSSKRRWEQAVHLGNGWSLGGMSGPPREWTAALSAKRRVRSKGPRR